MDNTLIIEHMSSSSCVEGDILWVHMYRSKAEQQLRRYSCYIKRDKTVGWEWYSGNSEPDMPADLRSLFDGSAGEYALDTLFSKSKPVMEITIPERQTMKPQLKLKTAAKPGDKFLIAAEYDDEGFIRIGHVSITGFSQLTCYEYPETRNEPYRTFVPGDIVYVDSWEGHPAYDVANADEPLYCWKKVIMLTKGEAEDGTVAVPDARDENVSRWIHCSHLKLLAKATDNNAWIVNTETGFKIFSCVDGVKTQRAVIDCADDAGREAITQYVIDYCKGLCDEIRADAINRYKAKYETE